MSKTREEWKIVDEVYGSVQAELIRGMLQAQDIEVQLIQEGAGRALGIGVAPLGLVQIFVPDSSYQEAKSILDEYYRDVNEA